MIGIGACVLLRNEPTEGFAKDYRLLDPQGVGQSLDVGGPLSEVPLI